MISLLIHAVSLGTAGSFAKVAYICNWIFILPSFSDWLILTDNLRTQNAVSRDSILLYVRVIHKISDMHYMSKFEAIKALLC